MVYPVSNEFREMFSFLIVQSIQHYRGHHSCYLRRISALQNDRRFRSEIVTKLFRHETMFNLHMNSFDAIIGNKADFFII